MSAAAPGGGAPGAEPRAEPLYAEGSVTASLPHLSPLVVSAVVAAAVGRPVGWIGFLLPLGPLAAAGAARAVGRTPVVTWRIVLAFSLVCAGLIGGSWLVLWAGSVLQPLRLLFPLALLAFLLGLVNFVLVAVTRAIRAVKAIPLQYPWIPHWLDRPLGLTPEIRDR